MGKTIFFPVIIQFLIKVFFIILFIQHDITIYNFINSFLSPLPERREMRFPKMPSGLGVGLNPGPLAS